MPEQNQSHTIGSFEDFRREQEGESTEQELLVAYTGALAAYRHIKANKAGVSPEELHHTTTSS